MLAEEVILALQDKQGCVFLLGKTYREAMGIFRGKAKGGPSGVRLSQDRYNIGQRLIPITENVHQEQRASLVLGHCHSVIIGQIIDAIG
jgi:hypothetical protein